MSERYLPDAKLTIAEIAALVDGYCEAEGWPEYKARYAKVALHEMILWEIPDQYSATDFVVAAIKMIDADTVYQFCREIHHTLYTLGEHEVDRMIEQVREQFRFVPEHERDYSDL